MKDSDIIVYENIQGSKIYINYDGDKFTIKARNLNTDPINNIDLALQKYYNKAFNYFENLDEKVKSLIPTNWWFCFQYFYDEKPSNIKYDRIPKNSMILTSIIKDSKHIFNYEEMLEYSGLLDIDIQPIMFNGILSDKQINLINYFLKTSPTDLEYIFGEDNFANFFYKILSPNNNNSILMNDGEFHDNVEKMIIKINNSDEISLALLNPLYRKSLNDKTEHADVYSILLLEFLEFLQTVEIDDINLSSKNSDELYIEIISKLYNTYCNHRIDKILNFKFIIPPFFYEDKFKINIDLIKNEHTKSLINRNDKLEYLFKILLSSLRTTKKKPIGVFTERSIELYNEMVKSIQRLIDRRLKIEREDILNKDELLDFDKFYQIKYPKDADGMVYPDLYKEIGQDIDSGQNKKKKNIIKKSK